MLFACLWIRFWISVDTPALFISNQNTYFPQGLRLGGWDIVQLFDQLGNQSHTPSRGFDHQVVSIRVCRDRDIRQNPGLDDLVSFLIDPDNLYAF